MAFRPILKEPNSFLRQKAVSVEVEEITTPEMQELVEDMIQTMYEADGIGLAGPQIGIGKRVIVVHRDHGPEAYFNPELTKKSLRKVKSDEGCLSVPGVFGIVKRHRNVTVKALNRRGEFVTMKAEGLPAIIFQHEIDHLNGVLFIDKVEGENKKAPAL